MKTWETIFTVSGIKDSEYDEVVESIEAFFKKKGLNVHTGIGTEEPEKKCDTCSEPAEFYDEMENTFCHQCMEKMVTEGADYENFETI